jgi:mannan endo-1,4-beta-mannosidase
MALKLGALALAMVAAGCSTEYVDPIRSEQQEPGVGGDPCLAWTDADSCRADAAHDCSFQPNPRGCLSSDPACAPGICSSGDPFVRRTGQSLSLRGAPYTFLGAISWGIAWAEGGCTIDTLPNQQVALDRTFDDLLRMRANALRIGGFQRFAGASGRDYASFDRVVAAARRAGVRLVFVLENWYAGCSRGQRDDAWFATGYTQPYDGYVLSYTEYVQGVTDHFRDEPTIVAWELMNEARADDFGVLDRFVQTTSALVRATDPNHLIALGLDGGGTPGTSRNGNPSNYQRLCEHPALDLIDAHDISGDPSPLPVDLQATLQVARALRKPIFAGANIAWLFDTSPDSFAARARIVDGKIAGAQNAGFAGFVIADYFPDWHEVPTFQFDSRPEDPLGGANGVIALRAPKNQ